MGPIAKRLWLSAGEVNLDGDLELPETARALIVFAHGSGSSRRSIRNRYVAAKLRESGAFGTLLFDLLTPAEELDHTRRFDIDLLTDRLEQATREALRRPGLERMPVGLFGASTGAAAAVRAAVRLGETARAVVSRGGRPDLAGSALERLRVPTLFIVGSLDDVVVALNRQAFAQLPAAEKRIEIVPGATHLFEEPGALEQVADLSRTWFERYLW